MTTIGYVVVLKHPTGPDNIQPLLAEHRYVWPDKVGPQIYVDQMTAIDEQAKKNGTLLAVREWHIGEVIA